MPRIEDHRLGGRVGEQLVPSRDFYWFCQSGQSWSNGQSGPVRGVKGRDGDINGPFTVHSSMALRPGGDVFFRRLQV